MMTASQNEKPRMRKSGSQARPEKLPGTLPSSCTLARSVVMCGFLAAAILQIGNAAMLVPSTASCGSRWQYPAFALHYHHAQGLLLGKTSWLLSRDAKLERV